MKEKIKNILQTIKEKLKIKDEQLKKPKEILEKLATKFSKKKKKPPSKLSLKIKRILFKIFNLKTISMFIGAAISLPAIAFLNYSILEYIHSNRVEKISEDSIVKANLGFATRNLIKELQQNKIKRKDLRHFIKELNKEDEYGNFKSYSPCDKKYKAYSESPNPGGVTFSKESKYEFKIMAYNCKIEPIACDTIKLKKPEKKEVKEDLKTKDKQDKDKKIEHKNIKAPSDGHKPLPEQKETQGIKELEDKETVKTIPPETSNNKNIPEPDGNNQPEASNNEESTNKEDQQKIEPASSDDH